MSPRVGRAGADDHDRYGGSLAILKQCRSTSPGISGRPRSSRISPAHARSAPTVTGDGDITSWSDFEDPLDNRMFAAVLTKDGDGGVAFSWRSVLVAEPASGSTGIG